MLLTNTYDFNFLFNILSSLSSFFNYFKFLEVAEFNRKHNYPPFPGLTTQ